MCPLVPYKREVASRGTWIEWAEENGFCAYWLW